MSKKLHWETIYKDKSPEQVSWTQNIPSTSISFFSDLKIDKKAPIIDVGGGESKFVDYLLEKGFENISVLDISENAINKTKNRLGQLSKKITWIISDINDFEPDIKYNFWHDRAVFHFLTSHNEINDYVKKVKLFSENFMIGTFSKSGPEKCSGLKITQYDQILLDNLFSGDGLNLKKFKYENHTTPFDTKQNFIFCCFTSENN
tara:strand:+ start:12110 stop:12721 length:612 start_codon:yes stop_codon:yes gene_type:complete